MRGPAQGADCSKHGNHVIPHVPVRQWALSLPTPLRLLRTAQPKLLTPVLQVVHRVITRHLLGVAGLKGDEADSGAVTLIQRIGSAANLNIYIHCLVLHGMYRRGTEWASEFVDALLKPLQAAGCIYRIAFVTRGEQKVLTPRGAMPRDADF